MTPEQLIEEGRNLQRPCVFLEPEGSGPFAGIWYEYDDDEIESTGYRCWITVDSRHVPGLPPSVNGYISVFTDEENSLGGRVEITPSWPDRPGTKLYARSVDVLPPIDAVFARGSEAVGEWIRSHGWDRSTRFNLNFTDSDRVVSGAYEDLWQSEEPVFRDDPPYAALGGWHRPGPDHDWFDLINEQLMVFTIRNSEPWVEAWRMRTGEFRVIHRIT